MLLKPNPKSGGKGGAYPSFIGLHIALLMKPGEVWIQLKL